MQSFIERRARQVQQSPLLARTVSACRRGASRPRSGTQWLPFSGACHAGRTPRRGRRRWSLRSWPSWSRWPTRTSCRCWHASSPRSTRRETFSSTWWTARCLTLPACAQRCPRPCRTTSSSGARSMPLTSTGRRSRSSWTVWRRLSSSTGISSCTCPSPTILSTLCSGSAASSASIGREVTSRWSPNARPIHSSRPPAVGPGGNRGGRWPLASLPSSRRKSKAYTTQCRSWKGTDSNSRMLQSG
mmetsp:Transcript_43857/g.136546  ORF Transcript_43857/g.136546 Transcript_43857/m.136546 type:complete len:244 (+) Transcript_43857:267-998(+)